MEMIMRSLEELKNLTLLSAKQALTTSDAARLTGLSKSHIYRLCCSHKIPHWKSDGGKLTYFSKDELTAWMLQHRVSTQSEIDQQAATYAVTGKHGRVAV